MSRDEGSLTADWLELGAVDPALADDFDPAVFAKNPFEQTIRSFRRDRATVIAATPEEAAFAIKFGEQQADREQAAYDRSGGFTGPNEETRKVFWDVNKKWRRLEAWGIDPLGDILDGKPTFPELAPYYKRWRHVSQAWKDQAGVRPRDQPAGANGVAAAENTASEYGYPGPLKKFESRIKDGRDQGYGSEHRIEDVDIEDSSDAYAAAKTVDNAIPNELKPNLGSKGEFVLPWWGKVALGLGLVGALFVGGSTIAAYLPKRGPNG